MKFNDDNHVKTAQAIVETIYDQLHTMISLISQNYRIYDVFLSPIFYGLIALLIGICFSYLMYYLKHKKVYDLAFKDAITQLPNGNLLSLTYPVFVAKAKHQSYVLVIQFEELSKVFATYGASVTESLLLEAANRLKHNVVHNGALFRLNNDTFVILVNGFKKTTEAEIFAKRLLASFNLPILEKLPLILHPRIGFVQVELNSTLTHVLQQCTLTLANPSTHNLPIVYFNTAIEQIMLREVSILEELQAIIAGHEPSRLYLKYQPQLQLMHSNVVSVEALARLDSKRFGAISPSEFIAIAERHHIIYELGLVLLNCALVTANQVNRLGLGRIRFAVNVSGKQVLHERFTADVFNLLALNNVEGNILELEITESIFLHDLNRVNEVLLLLRSKGIVISIDDFGTGYSSFSSLSELSVDIVKINGTFIRQIHAVAESENVVIAREIIRMAHALKLKIVAEEIEHEDEYQYLIQHKCDYLQGYYICRPLLPFDLIHFVQTTNA